MEESHLYLCQKEDGELTLKLKQHNHNDRLIMPVLLSSRSQRALIAMRILNFWNDSWEDDVFRLLTSVANASYRRSILYNATRDANRFSILIYNNGAADISNIKDIMSVGEVCLEPHLYESIASFEQFLATLGYGGAPLLLNNIMDLARDIARDAYAAGQKILTGYGG